MRSVFLALTALGLLSACSSLPSEGPRAGTVIGRAGDSNARGQYALVNLDAAVVNKLSAAPSPAFAKLTTSSSTAPIDLIGPGDTLSISIFESGTNGLFSGYRTSALGASPEALPRAVVDAAGNVSVPYAGMVRVAGLTPAEAQSAISVALKGKSADPQVVISVISNLANAVTVIGEVRNAGRFPLTANGDRLLDVIALAGGPTKNLGDIEVVLVRGEAVAHASLALLMNDPSQNVRLAPRDQIRLLARPRTYSTFGALSKVAQTPIENDRLTLAAAISRSGGLNDNRANASAVFLFRFERPELAQALGVKVPSTPSGTPIVYRLNLSDPAGYFLANSVEIRNDDLIYAPNADVTDLKKFFEFVQSVTSVIYDVRVTSVYGN